MCEWVMKHKRPKWDFVFSQKLKETKRGEDHYKIQPTEKQLDQFTPILYSLLFRWDIFLDSYFLLLILILTIKHWMEGQLNSFHRTITNYRKENTDGSVNCKKMKLKSVDQYVSGKQYDLSLWLQSLSCT